MTYAEELEAIAAMIASGATLEPNQILASHMTQPVHISLTNIARRGLRGLAELADDAT